MIEENGDRILAWVPHNIGYYQIKRIGEKQIRYQNFGVECLELPTTGITGRGGIPFSFYIAYGK